jgi:predicted SnoaL-like aldol condensation-catalyzing enzyme
MTAPFGVEANRALVAKYIETCFNLHEPVRAAEECLHIDYVQHNPDVATGRDGYLSHFVPFMEANPNSRCTVQRMLGDGDLVAVHSHWQLDPDDLGAAVVDIYLVRDGRIREHWDVIQPDPETMAHDNGMF